MHLMKCQDGKSIKHCLEAQHEHTMTILPIDDQKLAAEQLNYKKLFDCDFWLFIIFDKTRIAGILMTIFEAGINPLVIVGTNHTLKHVVVTMTLHVNIMILQKKSFDPIQDRGGGVQKGPPTSFSPVTSTNVGISSQNFGDVINRNYDVIIFFSKYLYFTKAWCSHFCWHHQNSNHIY